MASTNPSHDLHPLTPAMSTVDYNSKGTQLESEAEKFDTTDATAGAAVPVEHGGLSQYELANDPHRYVSP
jgi:hypothetical protein